VGLAQRRISGVFAILSVADWQVPDADVGRDGALQQHNAAVIFDHGGCSDIRIRKKDPTAIWAAQALLLKCDLTTERRCAQRAKTIAQARRICINGGWFGHNQSLSFRSQNDDNINQILRIASPYRAMMQKEYDLWYHTCDQTVMVVAPYHKLNSHDISPHSLL
jgi:hypothetical protein